MQNLLSGLDERSLELVHSAGALAHMRDMKAYLVGGPVRDLMLKKPVVDLDITIEGKAINLAGDFATEHAGQLVTYPAFKTATVTLFDDIAIDFVTARKEVYPRPGVFPVVTPSNIKDDLFRRDFTINAMAIALNPSLRGQLVDFFGGQEDLKGKKIRVLHAKSFLDDPTRILRAARFAGRLGFSIEEGTLSFLRAAIAQGAMATIKGQRYAKEIDKINKEDNKDEIMKRLAIWGALI